MITVARPNSGEASHFYYPDGKPCYEVPCKSRPGQMRKTTVADARKLALLPSPTTICKLLHRQLIVDYQIEQAVLATLTAPIQQNESLDAFVERIIHTDREHEQEREAAAERGREIHEALSEAMLSAFARTRFTIRILQHIKEPVEFLLKLGRTVATEKIVVGDGYAGMLDLLLQNDTELWIIDHKSAKNIPDKPYNEHRLQVAAYAGTFGNTGDLRLHCAVCYISTTKPGEWKIYEIENWQNDFARFKLLLKYWKLTNNL